MKNNKIFMLLIAAGIAFGACSGNKKAGDADSSALGSAADSSGLMTDSASDSTVKPADSTHSFRNDRGTDSVAAGKSVPEKP